MISYTDQLTSVYNILQHCYVLTTNERMHERTVRNIRRIWCRMGKCWLPHNTRRQAKQSKASCTLHFISWVPSFSYSSTYSYSCCCSDSYMYVTSPFLLTSLLSSSSSSIIHLFRCFLTFSTFLISLSFILNDTALRKDFELDNRFKDLSLKLDFVKDNTRSVYSLLVYPLSSPHT